jgi:hypothetical protein
LGPALMNTVIAESTLLTMPYMYSKREQSLLIVVLRKK